MHTLNSAYPDIVGKDRTEEDPDDELDDDDIDPDDEDLDEDDADKDDDVDALKTKISKLELDLRRAVRRQRNAARAKDKVEKELTSLKTGGQKELAEAQARVTELEEQLAAASGQDRTSLIREDFRDVTGYDWHNTKTAFALLDLSEVDVEDGKVDADSLKDAVAKLAAEHPYLLKSKSDKKDDDENDDDDKDDEQPARRSGSAGVGRKRKKPNQTTQLTSKFPALAGRVPTT